MIHPAFHPVNIDNYREMRLILAIICFVTTQVTDSDRRVSINNKSQKIQQNHWNDSFFLDTNPGIHTASRSLIDKLEKEVQLPKEDLQRCQSSKLVDQGKFIISKKVLGPANAKYIEYYAYLNEETKSQDDHMGLCYSQIRGDCNTIEIEDEYQGCRLGTYLTQVCLEDDAVGFDDFDTALAWSGRRNLIKTYCKNFKWLECAPDGDKWYACSGYMTAAINAGYELLLTSKARGNLKSIRIPESKRDTYLFKLEAAKASFKKDGAKPFLDFYGYYWHFCKCNENLVAECKKTESKDLVHHKFHSCVEVQ